jgi:hypothetical protein
VAPAVDDRVIERLQCGVTITEFGDVCPRLGGVVIHATEHPHPAVVASPGHRRVHTPTLVRAGGDDRPVMSALYPTTTSPLRGEQAVSSHQTQHPLTAGMDAVLAAQPGSDLAIALPTKR